MAYEFTCKSRDICIAPACICPRKEIKSNKMEDKKSNAEEALELIKYIKENGGMEVYNKYKVAEAYIEETGNVSPSFLEKLKRQKIELNRR